MCLIGTDSEKGSLGRLAVLCSTDSDLLVTVSLVGKSPIQL